MAEKKWYVCKIHTDVDKTLGPNQYDSLEEAKMDASYGIEHFFKSMPNGAADFLAGTSNITCREVNPAEVDHEKEYLKKGWALK
jgi:hypothetical protein